MNIEQTMKEVRHRLSTWRQMLDALKEIEDYLVFTDQEGMRENVTAAIKAAEETSATVRGCD